MPSRRVLRWWFGLMLLGGMAFGLNAEGRPFGDDILAHPLIVYSALVAAALLALRIILRRPVPEVITERMLFVGCIVGLAAYLAGNWIDVTFLHPAH